MATEILRVDQEGMTLDLLLWRRFTNEKVLRVEKALAANQDLAEFGPFLPVGTQVEIAVESPTDTTPYVEIIRLWN